MPADRLRAFQRSLALLPAALLLAGSNCNAPQSDAGTTDAGTGGPQLVTCATIDDCPDQQNYDCVGVCLYKCADDTICAAGEYCSDSGYCERGCRDSSTCDPGEVCTAGNCIPAENAASCGSKCDCEAGQVCTDGLCVAPPESCNSSEQCGRGPDDNCEAYSCNGFTNTCFYPNPPPCEDESDCAGRPGCEDGCACTPSGQCLPSVACTVDSEADDCGAGNYCNADLACEPLPACTDDSACSPLGLVCNTVASVCERANPCVDDTGCTNAPATYCFIDPPAEGVCTIPNCINGGVTCQDGFTCNQTSGICENEGGGDTCTSNSQCSPALWPDSEYCFVEPGQTEGSCTPGCQSTVASCPDGTVCNSDRQCVTDTGGGGQLGLDGDSCNDSSECAPGLVCHLLGFCKETCGPASDPCDPATDANCCSLTGYPVCSAGLLLSFCWPF